MSKNSISAGKMWLLGGAAVLATAMAPMTAQAVPYAFASNQITGLTLTGAFTLSPPPNNAAGISISDSANFGALPGQTFSASGTVGNALNIQAAVAGAGPATENTFTPLGAGAFGAGGSRSDASIGAGSVAQGGVAVNNVAEATGNLQAQSGSSNSSNISLRITSTGGTITLTASDLIRLIASTAPLSGETANATIGNTFEVRNSAGTIVGSYAPTTANRTVGSTAGTPALADTGNVAVALSFTTDPLIAGQDYSLVLRSIAQVTTVPGTVAVPEPMSLALFGMGLAGLGLVRRRRA